MNLNRKWMVWVGVVSLSLSSVGTESVFAQGEDHIDRTLIAAPSNNDSYEFTWLDPDKKIYVLQNRRYTKANKLLLSVGFGLSDTNAYRSTYAIEPRLTYYFSEHWGFEGFYTNFTNKENTTGEALRTSPGSSTLAPFIVELKSQVGGLINWAPWYAKINVFNWILYFDWTFSAGVGSINADTVAFNNPANATSKSMTGFYLGTGHQFHVSENFVIRLDFMNTWFKSTYKTGSTEETVFNSSTFSLGLGVRL